MIRRITYDQIPERILTAQDARANQVTFPPDAEYFAWLVGDDVAGVGGMKRYKSSTRLLAAYVLPEWRGKGIYTQLLYARIADCMRPIHAHSTKHSEAILLRTGFRTVRQFKTNKRMILE